jgi:hypothetical protein
MAAATVAVTLDIPVEAEVARVFRNSTPQTLQTIQHQGQFLVSNALGFLALSSTGASNHTLYEQDFYDWTQQTAALIRARQWYDLDPVALAEEVESLGISQKHALGSHLKTLVMHLLKWHYQPSMRQTGHSWQSSIINARDEIASILEDVPSLQPLVAELLTKRYPAARRLAHVETGLPLSTFPDTCPWPPEQVLDADFWPDQDSSTTLLR